MRFYFLFLIIALVPFFSEAQVGYMGKRLLLRYDLSAFPMTNERYTPNMNKGFPFVDIQQSLGLEMLVSNKISISAGASYQSMGLFFEDIYRNARYNDFSITREETFGISQAIGTYLKLRKITNRNPEGFYFEWGIRYQRYKVEHNLHDYFLQNDIDDNEEYNTFDIVPIGGAGVSMIISDHWLVDFGIYHEISYQYMVGISDYEPTKSMASDVFERYQLANQIMFRMSVCFMP